MPFYKNVMKGLGKFKEEDIMEQWESVEWESDKEL